MTDPDDHPFARLLGHVAFAIVIAVVVVRCLMLESIRSAGDFSGVGGSNTQGPGAATSIVLDWLSFVPVLLILGRRLLDPSRSIRFAWSSVLLAALAVWSLASVGWADDKFLALISAARIAGGAAIFWSATQLVTRWDHLRVIVGIVVGVLLVNVAQGVIYQNFELAELKQFWTANRAQIFESHGWKETDYTAQRFEMKVLAGEMLNFSVSANVLGAIVVSCALAAFAAGMQRIEDKDDQGWAGAMFLAALGSVYVLSHTGSKASWAALALGIAMLAGWRLTRGWLVRNRTRAFRIGIATIALAVAGIITLGLVRDGLPSASLNFRWRYWIGSWQLFHERPFTGIGWGNFGDAYLRHRLPEATEEIQDPHSFPVKWATELGLIGLTLGLTWLIAWAWRATPILAPSPGIPGEGWGEGSSESEISNLRSQNLRSQISNSKSGAAGSNSQAALTLTLSQSTGRGDQKPMRISRVLLACVPMLLLVLVCTIDFTGDGNYAVLETFLRCVHIALIALAIGLVCLGKRQSPDEPFYVDDRPAPWLAAGLFVAVVMMLVQSTIDIALFQPGPWVLVVVMMGALVGIVPDRVPRMSTLIRAEGRSKGTDEGTHPWHPIVLGAFTTVACLALLSFAVWPVLGVMHAEAAAGKGDSIADRQPESARTRYLQAFGISPASNFDYALKAGTAAIRDNTWWAREPIDAAIAAAPGHPMSWLTRSRYLSSQKTIAPADAQQSLDDFGRAVALNPNDVDLRIEYADLLERFGHRAEAAVQLEAALAMDDKLDRTEPERLELRSPGKYDAIRKRITALRAS